MIIIVSNENDGATNNVIRYLKKNGYNYVRMTEALFIDSIDIQLDNSKVDILFSVKGKNINYDDIYSFWFRKNKIELFSNLKTICPDFFIEDHKNHINNYIVNEEVKSLQEFLVFSLEQKHHLGNVAAGNGNKLKSFVLARNCGLKIPSTVVSSNLKILQKFAENKTSMAKAIEEGYYYSERGYSFSTVNKLFVNDQLPKNIDDTIYPSCLQEYVDKKIELRIFYLNRQCYSMAIFSQTDKKTQIDFRNYNDEQPNRMLPYNLPKNIENNIDLFMNKMDLKTGSIDMILTKNNEYVFLEVNPVGQYGFVSAHCNYPLDLLIFKYLTQ